MSRPDVASVRAAWWALRALRQVRAALKRDGVGSAVLLPPPGLPEAAGRGVRAVLRRVRPTCLERALVLQRWLAAHGVKRDVVIGVRSPADGFAAHAWVDGESPHDGQDFHEIERLAP